MNIPLMLLESTSIPMLVWWTPSRNSATLLISLSNDIIVHISFNCVYLESLLYEEYDSSLMFQIFMYYFHIYRHIHIYGRITYIYIYRYRHIYIYISILMYYSYMNTYIYIYIHKHIIHIYIYLCMYIFNIIQIYVHNRNTYDSMLSIKISTTPRSWGRGAESVCFKLRGRRVSAPRPHRVFRGAFFRVPRVLKDV